MVEIIPTILTSDPLELETELQSLSGVINRVQIDIIDGIFKPEKTISLEELRSIETPLKLDVHLMVNEPANWINRCVEVLADRIIGQVEMMKDQELFVSRAAETVGLGIGFGLDIDTPVSRINIETLLKLDLVLIMTRKAGFEPAPFEEKALEKVKELRNLGYAGEIYVDGGINESNIVKCIEAGADLLAVGSAIWKAGNIAEEIQKLKIKSYNFK